MRRRRRGILVACSLALCVAVLACWARSHFRTDGIQYVYEISPDRKYRFNVHPVVNLFAANLDLLKAADDAALAEHTGWTVESSKYTPREYDFYLNAQPCYRLADFGVGREPASPTTSRAGLPMVSQRWSVWFPYWVPAIAFAVAPLLWLRRYRLLRRRIGRGACAECGYDLQATPGRCPECGTLPLTGA